MVACVDHRPGETGQTWAGIKVVYFLYDFFFAFNFSPFFMTNFFGMSKKSEWASE